MTEHDCSDHGHVWLETDGTPYTRHRGRTPADVSVTVSVSCKHCGATADLPRNAGFSGPRAPGQPVDTTIPPQFKVVLDRAVAEAPNTGPVPKPE